MKIRVAVNRLVSFKPVCHKAQVSPKAASPKIKWNCSFYKKAKVNQWKREWIKVCVLQAQQASADCIMVLLHEVSPDCWLWFVSQDCHHQLTALKMCVTIQEGHVISPGPVWLTRANPTQPFWQPNAESRRPPASVSTSSHSTLQTGGGEQASNTQINEQDSL